MNWQYANHQARRHDEAPHHGVFRAVAIFMLHDPAPQGDFAQYRRLRLPCAASGEIHIASRLLHRSQGPSGGGRPAIELDRGTDTTVDTQRLIVMWLVSGVDLPCPMSGVGKDQHVFLVEMR